MKLTDNTFKYSLASLDEYKNLNYINIYAYANFINNQNNSQQQKNIFNNLKAINKNKNECGKQRCDVCLKNYKIDTNIEDINNYDALTNSISNSVKNSDKKRELCYLNLSGCYRLTDFALR